MNVVSGAGTLYTYTDTDCDNGNQFQVLPDYGQDYVNKSILLLVHPPQFPGVLVKLMSVLNYVKMDSLTLSQMKEENASVIALVLILSAQVLLHFVPLVMTMPALVTYILTKHLTCVAAVLTQTLVWLLTFLTLFVLNVSGMEAFLCCWSLFLFC